MKKENRKPIDRIYQNKLKIEFKSEKLDTSSDFKIKIFINNKLKGESTAPTIKQGEKDASKIAYENIDK